MRILCSTLLLFFSFLNQTAYSQKSESEFTADVESYCKYIRAKNLAKTILLQSPEVITRLQNTNGDDYLDQNKLIAGLSKNIIDFNKAKHIKQLTEDECRYYAVSQEAKLQIQFAIPTIQKKALQFKLNQIQRAKNKLAKVLRDIEQKIERQSETLAASYQVDILLSKLHDTENEIKINLAMQQSLPEIKTMGLNALLNQVYAAQKKRQQTRNKLTKQNNWSIQLQAGAQQYQSVHQNQNTQTQPYVALFMQYNLGSIFSNTQLDKSLDLFSDWKSKQINDTEKQLVFLIQSIKALRSTEQVRLNDLIHSHQKFYKLGAKINIVDSLKARHLKQKIEIDQILTEIEINYVKYIIKLSGEMVAAQ